MAAEGRDRGHARLLSRPDLEPDTVAFIKAIGNDKFVRRNGAQINRLGIGGLIDAGNLKAQAQAQADSGAIHNGETKFCHTNQRANQRGGLAHGNTTGLRIGGKFLRICIVMVFPTYCRFA